MTDPRARPLRPKKAKQSIGEKLWVVAVVVLIAGVAVALVWSREQLRGAPPADDVAAEIADVAAFRSVVVVGDEGWVAEIPTGWSTDDLDALRRLCDRAFAGLGGGPHQTLTLIGDGPLVECGDTVGSAGGPRR